MSAAEPLPSPNTAPSVRTQMPRERCGTFTQAPVKLDESKVCATCAALLRKEIRLYPYVYMNVVGMLLNFTVAAFLAAINWKRLGDRERLRNTLVIGAFGIAWTIASMAFGIPFKLLFPVGIVATWVATQGLKEPCEEHWKAGGARANRLWPVLITLGVFLVALGVFLVYVAATALPDEEY